MTTITDRYIEAVAYALRKHQFQQRKTSPAPFVAHILSVSSLVLEHDGSETEAIAGLLHDVLEDTETTQAELAERFGDDVVALVVECTDPLLGPDKLSSYTQRKQAKLDRLHVMSESAILVYACDKLHNLRQIAEDMRDYGESMWTHTNGGYEGTIGWYSAYLSRLTERLGPRRASLRSELVAAIGDVQRVAAECGLPYVTTAR